MTKSSTTEDDWEKRLRDLYLTITPDDEGSQTRSFLFNWGRFTFERLTPDRVEFYLATKDSIEEFIGQTLASQRIALMNKTKGQWGKHYNLGYFEGKKELMGEIWEWSREELKKQSTTTTSTSTSTSTTTTSTSMDLQPRTSGVIARLLEYLEDKRK